ncbi:MAG: RNA polymerase sigma-I factor [Peptococcaceae bacterium]|nr:RNA polymerase sigma-I factor [Peptococcaceae bacterium]
MSGLNPVSENPLAMRLKLIKGQNDLTERNNFIQDYIPFIIKAVSNQINRYVEIENSDEFSIGLIAFNEAIDKYDETKGSFLSFAELVIRNRVKDLYRKKQKEQREISLENYKGNSPESLLEPYCEIDHESISLNEEIQQYEIELRTFGISFEDLVKETPKHIDTRRNAVQLSERISEDQVIVKEIYAKKRLPVSKIVLRFKTTVKIIKRSKKFILSTVLIFTGNFFQLKLWVKNSLQGERNV